MFEFLTAALFKVADDGSVHFFPLSRKHGYVLENPEAAAWIASHIRAWWFFWLVGSVAILFIPDDPEMTATFLAWSAIALAGYFVPVYRATRGLPKSPLVLSRQERRDNVLRSQSTAVPIALGFFGLALAITPWYFAYELTFLWPFAAFYSLLGIAFIVSAVRSYRRRRQLLRGA